MNRLAFTLFCGIAATSLGVTVPCSSIAAGKPGTAPIATKFQPPRKGGRPDLSGIWQVLNTANWNIEPHSAQAALQMRAGPIQSLPAPELLPLGAIVSVPAGPGVVEGGAIPYRPDALKKRDLNRAQYLKKDPEIKCYLPGVPRANYMSHPLQILQSDGALLIAYEYDSAVRNVLFKDPGPPPVDSWMGQSVGRWEGDTLVVKVTGQLDNSWFDRAGNHHSDQMVVEERYTLTSPNTMRYEATITDPETFTRPWKMSMVLYKHVEEDARLQQFKCVEFVEELIYGNLRKAPAK
ncbi:MAG: hypothetical protein JWM33_3556 [Caulobacteraceae bacterium]|nr:hypothetical protein [Caulobacteraceae bacterium]